MNTKDFSRQSFLGPRSDEVLAATSVAIVGLGGGGSHVAQQLAHLGVGQIALIDPDVIDPSNLNRLVGATDDDVQNARPKVDIARRTIFGIRPWIQVVAAQKKWQDARDLLKDAHVIFGCLDGFLARDSLESAARRNLLPYIDIGMNVVKLGNDDFAVSGQLIVTRPDGPCMRCLGFLTDALLNEDENRYGDAGHKPQVVWPNGILASLAVGAFVKLVTPWSRIEAEYTWLEFDGNSQSVVKSRQPEFQWNGSKCPHHGGPDGLGSPFFSLFHKTNLQATA